MAARAWGAALVVALGALLTACPESVHPVTDPADAAHDRALFGVWRGSFEKGSQVYLHVEPDEHGMTRVVYVEHDKQRRIKVERYSAFPSRLGKLQLLNVRNLDVDEEHGYVLFRYRAEKRGLTLWMLSLAAAKTDIQAGKLKGIAREGTYGETRITASSVELADYLKLGDAKRLFDKPLVFRRLAGG